LVGFDYLLIRLRPDQVSGAFESLLPARGRPIIENRHDLLTSGAISLLAFMAADLSHEVLGHGSVAVLEHAKVITLFYTALSSDISSRTLVLAGPAVNLVSGAAGFALLQAGRVPSRAAWFLFLFASMSVMGVSAYLMLSGVTGTGDMAVAFAGLPYQAIIRSGMIVAGLASYIVLVRFMAAPFRRFAAPAAGICAAAYAAPLILNTAAAWHSPLGLHYYLLSALPATAGVNLYLLILPRVGRDNRVGPEVPDAVVTRSLPWILAAAALGTVYVLLLGPGIVLRS
jgi:hypothetical protein